MWRRQVFMLLSVTIPSWVMTCGWRACSPNGTGRRKFSFPSPERPQGHEAKSPVKPDPQAGFTGASLNILCSSGRTDEDEPGSGQLTYARVGLPYLCSGDEPGLGHDRDLELCAWLDFHVLGFRGLSRPQACASPDRAYANYRRGCRRCYVAHRGGLRVPADPAAQ